jgi:hypothetical protein
MQMSCAVYLLAVFTVGVHLSVLAGGSTRMRDFINSSLTGKCTQLDPAFAYFQNRSLDSIAEELEVRGYKSVSMTSSGGGKFPLADVLASHGINVRLLIVPMNGMYDTPPELRLEVAKWKMVHKDPNFDAFAYFCLNSSGLRTYKQKQFVDTLLENPAFTAVDLAEPQIPAWTGPDDPAYGCLCDTCRKIFLSMHPAETDIPNFTDPSSPRYWKEGKALYNKWVDFRVHSVADFLDFIVNGRDGIRERCPNVKVITWTLGCRAVGGDVVGIEREWQAMDAAAVISKVKPDAHSIQTDWPDWVMPSLPADYVKKYAPYLKSIRSVNSSIPVTFQTDSGSNTDMHRSFAWLDELDKCAKQVGYTQTLNYQYHLESDFYTKSPSLSKARLSKSGGRLTLIYDMCVDSRIATDTLNYRLSRGKVVYVSTDGNLVILGVEGLTPGSTVTVKKMGNNPDVLCHKGHKQNISGPAAAQVTAE